LRPYQYGYIVEHECRKRLKQKYGAKYVIRSSRSLGPADLIAIFPERREIWLIQVKKEQAPKDLSKLQQRFKTLVELGGEYQVIPYAFMKVKGKYNLIKLEVE